MATSTSLRGKEATLLIAVNGRQQDFVINTTDLSITERGDLVETPHLGKVTTSLDYRHDGWDVSFTTEIESSSVLDFITTITEAEINSTAHPEITMTVLYKLRGSAGVLKEVYYEGIMRAPERSMGSRDDFLTQSFECKFERRIQF